MNTQKEQWEQKEHARQVVKSFKSIVDLLSATVDVQGNEQASAWMSVSRSMFSMLDRNKDYLPQSFVSKFYDVAVTIDARCRFGNASMTQDALGNDIDLPTWLKNQREWLNASYAKLTGKV